MRQITEIIIHCSASVYGADWSAADIDKLHRQRGFKCIGYHYVIRLNGEIERGRNIEAVGAHCLGHNQHSIGICYIGGLDKLGRPSDTRTPEQKRALTALLYILHSAYPKATIHGHREFAAKACPCFDASIYNQLLT